MIRIYGKALVATWRPFEEGGQSHMRASQIQSDNVTILDQVVIAQHKDGYWGTYELGNCSVIWQGKPTVTHIGDDDHETALAIVGSEHTYADGVHQKTVISSKTRAMSSSDGAMEGALDTQFYRPPAQTKRIVEEEEEGAEHEGESETEPAAAEAEDRHPL